MSWLMLVLMAAVPIIGGLLVAFGSEARARSTALWAAMASIIPVAFGLFKYDWSRAADFQGGGSLSWLPEFGLRLSVGSDGVSMMLIALTALLSPICVLASWTAITDRMRLYYAWLLVLSGAMIGVFMARDLLVFYICFEFTLLPMFVLIRCFGSTNRVYASTKFFLYTFTGSLLTLAGLVYLAWWTAQQNGEWSLDIGVLTASARTMSLSQQSWILGALLAGFAVKVPLFPVHTWLPLAHTEAPTAGSVILAGVLLKLGTYGIFRFCLGMVPAALAAYAPELAVLAIIGIIYAGLICWVQDDIKKLVAYSSVSHLGFCVLGMLAGNQNGITGSVLYMLSHGLSTGALFLMIGMMYERYHTRDMRVIGGLGPKMPVWATFMVFFTLASVGLPGLNGFPSELLCLIGAFASDSNWVMMHEPGAQGGLLGPWYAAIAGIGMVIAAMYLLYMVGKICFGELREPPMHDDDEHATKLPTDLNAREIGILLPLALGCLLFGLYPKLLTDAIEAPIQQTVAGVAEATRGEMMESYQINGARRQHDAGSPHQPTHEGAHP